MKCECQNIEAGTGLGDKHGDKRDMVRRKVERRKVPVPVALVYARARMRDCGANLAITNARELPYGTTDAPTMPLVAYECCL